MTTAGSTATSTTVRSTVKSTASTDSTTLSTTTKSPNVLNDKKVLFSIGNFLYYTTETYSQEASSCFCFLFFFNFILLLFFSLTENTGLKQSWFVRPIMVTE